MTLSTLSTNRTDVTTKSDPSNLQDLLDAQLTSVAKEVSDLQETYTKVSSDLKAKTLELRRLRKAFEALSVPTAKVVLDGTPKRPRGRPRLRPELSRQVPKAGPRTRPNPAPEPKVEAQAEAPRPVREKLDWCNSCSSFSVYVTQRQMSTGKILNVRTCGECGSESPIG